MTDCLPLCPECGASAFPIDQPHFGLDILDITTPDDRELGNIRLALRCQWCGFATSFIGRQHEPGCPAITDDESDYVYLGDPGRCTCSPYSRLQTMRYDDERMDQ